MARLRGHRALNEDRPLFVLRKALVADGRTFEVGEEFPWRELGGVTPRLLRLLHDQHRIGHERPEEPAQGAEDPPRSQGEQKRADERERGRKPPAKPAAKPVQARGIA